MARTEWEILPEYGAELEEIRQNGITKELLYDIIQKHLPNSTYNRQLYKRYMGLQSGVPIYGRTQRYEEEENPINNHVSNDFFSEIVNFKVGYYAGSPASYSYSTTKEAEAASGGEKAVENITKTLTDFITRNNMFYVDMETTKNASIYGYSGRLFYVDKEGIIRVMPVHGYETIILSDTDISEPECAIRYYESKDIHGASVWTVDFYDNKYMTTFKGNSFLDLEQVEVKEHSFDYCPLQGIANNKECMGDAENVLSLIDDYDKVVSDNSNEIESFANALLLVSLQCDDDVIKKAQKSGTIIAPPVGSNAVSEPVRWITKNINDSFTEHHLERVEDNIYRFSRTPNLGDDSFGTASGVSLKFKLHGIDTKCAAFDANVMNAAQYMWRVLCSAWNKKKLGADPLQFILETHRTFPLDKESEARTIQAYIAAGLPKRYAYAQLSDVDDVEYIMDLQKQEAEDAMEMYEGMQGMMQQQQEPEDNDANQVEEKE